MNFLGLPVEDTRRGPHFERRRKRIALLLLEKFQKVFPEITYQLVWDSPTINAQAWRLGEAHYVRVYGGLVRHQRITSSGLALTLAHETGHHLGGLPHDPAMPGMTWQGRADYWAAAEAMPKVWGPRARRMTLKGAREIVLLHSDITNKLCDDEPDLAPDCRYRIFSAGAMGDDIPSCAADAFASVSRDDRTRFFDRL